MIATRTTVEIYITGTDLVFMFLQQYARKVFSEENNGRVKIVLL